MRSWYFSVCKRILQTCMRCHPVGLDVRLKVGPFVYYSSCVQTAMALARLRRCAGSPEPLLVACMISTIFSWAGSLDQFVKMMQAVAKNDTILTAIALIIHVMSVCQLSLQTLCFQSMGILLPWQSLVSEIFSSQKPYFLHVLLMGQVMWKCVLCHMRTTKVQISLRIRAVSSAPLLFAA